jgi:hypothetical protein
VENKPWKTFLGHFVTDAEKRGNFCGRIREKIAIKIMQETNKRQMHNRKTVKFCVENLNWGIRLRTRPPRFRLRTHSNLESQPWHRYRRKGTGAG